MGEAMIEFSAMADVPGRYLEGAGGDTPLVAASVANVAAALSTTGFGAVAPLPRWPEVRARMGHGGVLEGPDTTLA